MTPKPPSKVELAKRRGRHLRGSIGETLASDATHFGHDDVHLLKFHGTYQQDDRDARRQLEAAGREKASRSWSGRGPRRHRPPSVSGSGAGR
jgi:sulfite reductase (ferredoxin)